jgi:putative transposase
MIEPDNARISVHRQCELIDLSRSTYYHQICCKEESKEEAAKEKLLLNQIDEIYIDKPFFGSRKISETLKNDYRLIVNRKSVQRLMRKLGIQAIVPGPHTSKPHPTHKIYPYLLRNLVVSRINQVWSTDITYVRTERGMCYLVVVVDWYSRKVLSWRLSNTMDNAFCIEVLQEALEKYGVPEYFNTDQGSQFTSDAFIAVLKAHDIKISMDGRGRALDNVFVERFWRSLKYENIFIKGYVGITEASIGIGEYIEWFNGKRIHASLDYETPDSVYFNKTRTVCAA